MVLSGRGQFAVNCFTVGRDLHRITPISCTVPPTPSVATELEKGALFKKGHWKPVENKISDFLYYVGLGLKAPCLKMITCLVNLQSNDSWHRYDKDV